MCARNLTSWRPGLLRSVGFLHVNSFPPFSFDADQATLWRGADKIRLTPKASALLNCLIAGRGAWISKPAIMAAVWPGTHVQPDNIKVLVREIRQALGDSPIGSRFISSSPKRGYAFVAHVTDDPAARGPRSIPPPTGAFVGRRQELSGLLEAFDDARAGQPRLVLVSGERGLGKTTLCEAFIRVARALPPVAWCVGQCFERESPSEACYPLLDALSRLARQQPELVQPALTQHAPSWLAHFPQWLGGDAMRKAPSTTVVELAHAFAAMSAVVPIVLVVEDLQWADAETLQVLEELAAHRRAALLIIGTYCGADWIAGRRAMQRVTAARPRASAVRLRPLTIDQVQLCVDARLGSDMVPDIAPAMHQASMGSPYIVRLALDRVVGRGLVPPADDWWRRAAARDAIVRALPELIAGAVAEQIDHLDPRERELLEAAAAVGRDFTAGQIAFALGARRDDTRRRLATLARRGQLIVARRPDGSPPSSYRFRHELCVEVISRRAPMARRLHTLERLGSRRP